MSAAGQRRRSSRLRQVATHDEDETSHLPPRLGRQQNARDDGARTFRVDDPPATTTAFVQRPTDSDDDEESVDWNQPSAPPAPKVVPPKAVHPKPTPPPPRAVNAVQSERERRRAVARDAMKTIRRDLPSVVQTGVKIPGYNDTAELAQIDDAERNVVVDQRALDTLVNGTPAQYQAENKPPWAPRLPAYNLSELMTWEAIAVFTTLDLEKEDWYWMVKYVAGQVHVKVDAFVRFNPTDHTGPVSRTGTAAAGGFPDTAPSGPSEMSRALANMVGATPARLPGLFGNEGTGLPIEPLPPLAQPAQPSGGDRDVAPQSLAQIDNTFINVVEAVLSDPSRVGQVMRAGKRPAAAPEVVQSGGRFEEFRKRARARAPPTPFYVNGTSESDRVLGQTFRAATAAAAQTWATRAVATGVYYLAPVYTSARDRAHALILSRARQLAHVKLQYFIRAGDQNDLLQKQVRVQFGGLVADLYNEARHNSDRSAKLATDARNFTRGGEDKIRWFMTRVNFFNGRFVDSGLTSYAELQPSERREVIHLPPSSGRCVPCDPHSLVATLGYPPGLCNPLLYVPGTTYVPAPRPFL